MSQNTKQSLPKYSTQPKLSKSPKSLDLDRLVKSYKRFKIQGLKQNGQGPIRDGQKGLNTKSKNFYAG